MFKTTPCGWDSATQSLGEWLEGPEVTFLRLWYDTLNPDLLNPDIHWHNLDGSPYGGTFIGRAAVRDGYFAPLQRDFEDWRVTVEEVIGSGSAGHMVGLGPRESKSRSLSPTSGKCAAARSSPCNSTPIRVSSQTL
jgi:ketosteroid isomerase-like protein